jgi:transposase
MDVIVERCAGLDVGKDEVVACVRTPRPSGKGRQSEMRVFRTFTSSLEELADWLTANGVVEVVMEATGPYWKPIWYVLEDRGFDLKLVNAKHVKMVPGHKTDMADAAWLAERRQRDIGPASERRQGSRVLEPAVEDDCSCRFPEAGQRLRRFVARVAEVGTDQLARIVEREPSPP